MMGNPIFNQMQQANMNSNFLQRFMQFKNGYTGNAQQQVQQLLNSGRITQTQYNQAVQMAQQFQRMLVGR